MINNNNSYCVIVAQCTQNKDLISLDGTDEVTENQTSIKDKNLS